MRDFGTGKREPPSFEVGKPIYQGQRAISIGGYARILGEITSEILIPKGRGLSGHPFFMETLSTNVRYGA